MLPVTRAGERNHPQLYREAEHDLRHRRAMRLGHPANRLAGQFSEIRGQQREALIDDAFALAHASHVAVPAQPRVTAVLYECRPHLRNIAKKSDLLRRDVADADQLHTAFSLELLHRSPYLAIDVR